METIPYEAESYQSKELEFPEEARVADISLEPCPTCTRTFAPRTLRKHILICEKTVVKKRKAFDSSRQRREGTDLADFLPKNFGLPTSKHEPAERLTRQVSTPVLQKKEHENVKTPNPSKRPLVPAVSVSCTSKEKLKPVLSRLAPTAEPCPHCDRSFGPKAYDRHVEWCKEKSRIANPLQTPSTNVAKERLQARTKYRAPCLKTKRAVNREKYSGLSCEESMNSLSDGGSGGSACKSKEYTYEDRCKMDISMTSSIMSSSQISEGSFSDKYDPFISAKRQLEELCSPTEESKKSPVSLPLTPNIKKDAESMSKSFTAHSINKLSDVKSNFHRTYSLRNPSKSTLGRPVFSSNSKQKPNVQRGISDEGPISTSFLKPEEYDEMPVKSVCINDFASSRHPDNQSTPKIVKRDPHTNRNRRNLKMSLSAVERKGLINPLSKTDSLAIFLHYENATRATDIPVNLTEKDLKDKSNNLSKQTSSKSSASDLDNIQNDKDTLCSLKNSLSNLLDSHATDVEHLVKEETPLNLSKLQSIRLEPLPNPIFKDKSHYGVSPLTSKENDFIDPKLINVCDNLSMNVTKLSDNDLTSSSTESIETVEQLCDKQDNILNSQTIHRNSTERKNLLKRQLRLNKNHFLYDQSPENDSYTSETEKDVSVGGVDSNKLNSSVSTTEPIPDEFDIEEFLSSFDNVEEYPLLKNYKAFLSNRSLNKISNNSRESSRSPINMCQNNNDDDEGEQKEEKNEIFSSNESFLKHEALCPTEQNTPKKSVKLNDLNENRYDHTSSLRSVDSEDKVLNIPDTNENIEIVEDDNENANTHNDVTNSRRDLSKPSSLESLDIKKSASSKQSADSAYGSLSRHSPVDRVSRRTSTLRSPIQDYPDESLSAENFDGKRRIRAHEFSNHSVSSEDSCHNQLDIVHNELVTRSDVKDIRMSKFCHECGNKFILAQAKFCMECGAKRIVLE